MVLLFAYHTKNFRNIKFITLAVGVNRLSAEIWPFPPRQTPTAYKKILTPALIPGYINLNNLD